MAFSEDTSVFFDTADFGESATYCYTWGGQADISVIVDTNAELFGAGYSEVSDRRTVISLQKASVEAVTNGDQIIVGDAVYTVDALINDDGKILDVSVK